MIPRMITASLSPNAEIDDVSLALKTLYAPWTWKSGAATDDVVSWFKKIFGVSNVSLFSSGRMALTAILSSFDIGNTDEVLVQAFTCVAVPNSVKWTGATPIYVDIDASGNIDVSDAQRKCSKKTKAIIVQHTFGIAADIKKIKAFAHKNKLKVIEDCAHSLGLRIDGTQAGTHGDAVFFSFGRDKVVSSIWGGVAIIHDVHTEACEKLMALEDSLAYPTNGWIMRQLMHPILFAISMPFYRVEIGKMCIAFFRTLRLITLPIYTTEYKGGRPMELNTRYPNALALLLVHQLSKLDGFTKMRSDTADAYKQIIKNSKKIQTFASPHGASYLRFPILVDEPDQVSQAFKKRGILLGHWYRNVIDPKGVSFDDITYKTGGCPRAEAVSKKILNLPTRLTKVERDRVCAVLSFYV